MIELVGDQIRIRIVSPALCAPDSFRTQDVGSSGKLQRTACKSKTTGKYFTQAWSLNLADYSGRDDAIRELRSIRGLSKSQISKGTSLIKKWFK